MTTNPRWVQCPRCSGEGKDPLLEGSCLRCRGATKVVRLSKPGLHEDQSGEGTTGLIWGRP